MEPSEERLVFIARVKLSDFSADFTQQRYY